MKYSLLYCFLYIFFGQSFAQSPSTIWNKSFDWGSLSNDRVRSAIPLSEGGFLLAGIQKANTNGVGNIWLLKLNASGVEVKRNIYDQPSLATAMSSIESIVETDDGYVVVCQSTETNAPKNRRFKVDKSELSLLEGTDQHTTGGNGNCIARLRSGLLLMGSQGIGGAAQLEVLNEQDLTTIALLDNDSKETPELWGRNIRRILPTPDGGCYLLGEDNGAYLETGCSGIKSDIWVCRLNADLKPVWSRTYGGFTTDFFLDGELRAGGNVVVLGRTTCTVGSASGPSNIGAGAWIMELNPRGDLLTVRSLRAFDLGTGNNQVLGLALLPNCPDALLLTGTEIVSSGTQGYVAKVRMDERTEVAKTGTGFWTIPFAPSIVTPGFKPENVVVLPDTNRIFVWGTATKSMINGYYGDFYAALIQPDASPCAPKIGTGATPLTCGQKLTNENTNAVGAQNILRIGNYLGAPNIATNEKYDGPEKVYALNIAQSTNLRIILDIGTQNNIGLDMFLIQDNGGAVIASSAANNKSTSDFKREILECIVAPGKYYLIVDGRKNVDRGFYDLMLDCGCSACPCAEPTNDLPNGLKLLSEDFDTFRRSPSGNPDPQSTRWNLEPSSQTTTAIPQVVKLGNESQTLQITGMRQPIAWHLAELPLGRYRLSFQLFVAANKNAWYSIFKENRADYTHNYEISVYFNSDGHGIFNTRKNNDETRGQFNYTVGQWINIVHILDIGKDSMELWIDGNFCGKRAFNDISGNDPNDATDNTDIELYTPRLVFFGDTDSDYRVDNLCLWQQGFCNPVPLTDSCFSSPGSTFYASEADARCALYTSKELQPCRSVCETPATVFHREPDFKGVVGPASPPNLALLSDCVREAYLDQGDPFPRFADLVLFYNESSKNVGITLERNGADHMQAFVFQCLCEDNIDSVFQISDDVITINGCEQLCLGLIGEDYSNDTPRPRGYYYILVLSTNPDAYGLEIIPEGPCGKPILPMVCGVPINSNLNNETNTLKKGDKGYQIYDGSRSYAGRDKIYTFTLSRAQYVDLSLLATTPLGLFLFTDRCGENPILYRELPEGGGTVRLDSFYLPAAQYYVCIDESEPNKGGNFVLRLDQCIDASLSQVLTQIGFADEANCPKNTQQIHQISLDSPELFDPPIAISINDVVHFKFLDQNNNERVAEYKIWDGNPAAFKLASDQQGDPLFCGYQLGEPLRLAVHQYLDNTTSQYVDYTITTTGPQTFEPDGISSITAMEKKSPVYFVVNPQIFNPSNKGGEYLVQVGSNGFNWRIAPAPGTPPAPWVKIPYPDGRNTMDRPIQFDPNPDAGSRTAVLDVFNTDGPHNFKIQIKIVQSGDCSIKPGGDIKSNVSSICPGDTLRLSLTLPPNAQAPEMYDYLWSTGQTGESIGTIVPDLSSTKVTYTVSVYDRVCGTVGTVTEVVNLKPGAWATSSIDDPQVYSTNDLTGASVAFSGNWAAVGAPQFDNGASRPNAGRVLLYERVQSGKKTQWVLRETLLGTNSATNRLFGMRLNFHGDYLVVGAPGTNGQPQGAAYIFKKNKNDLNKWGEVARFDPPSNLASSNFGSAVGLYGDYLMVGAEKASQTVIYHRNQREPEAWTPVKTLTATANSNFGGSLAMDNDMAVIGARTHNTTLAGASGMAIVYQHRPKTTNQLDPHNWVAVDSLIPNASIDLLKAGDQLGYAVDINGSHIILGAPKHDNGNANAGFDNGAAWLFERDPAAIAQWKRVRKLNSATSMAANFGNAVALGGEYALIGAEQEPTRVRGAAYAYHRLQGPSSWGLVEKIVPSTTVSNPIFQFGSAVAASESSFLIGAAQYDTFTVSNRGRGYFFHTTCLVGAPPKNNSASVTIQEISIPTLSLECHPIPFDDQLTIAVDATDVSQANVAVIDVTGRVVEALYQGHLDGFHTFIWNTSAAKPGMYYVVVRTPSGKTIKPVVKMRP